MSACVASVLEMDIADVPNPHGEGWFAQWQAWLAARGLALLNFPLDPDNPWCPVGYWIAAVECGPLLHAVVMKDDELAWNAHPNRNDGVGQAVEATVFVATDPARMVHDT